MTLTVEQLREAEHDFVLSETSRERLRAAEQNAEANSVREATAVREAVEALDAASDELLLSRTELLASAEAYTTARANAPAVRARYVAAWNSANKHGVAGERIEPGAFPPHILGHLQSAANGEW